MNPEAVDPDAKEQSRRRAQEIAALEQRAARRDAFAAFVLKCVPPLIGFALFVLVWHGIATLIPSIPTPGATWNAAVPLFADPFYRNGPNDQGIGWNVLASLARVAAGFGLAAVVGIPAGFLGRFAFLNAMASPVISLLRPVSPLAWLPIGLLVFKAANPAAIWAIFICSIWPMVINTAVGVSACRRTT
jgi:nitrate/nitrite transport system permease protein